MALSDTPWGGGGVNPGNFHHDLLPAPNLDKMWLHSKVLWQFIHR